MGNLRRMVERFSRERTHKRRLPATFGQTPIIVSPDAALRYYKPGSAAFDAELLRFAEEFVTPGATVWDLGANVGAFTFAAAYRAGAEGKVVGIEADSWLVSILNKSARLPQNQSLPVEILAAAITDHIGIVRFHIAARGRASNALADAGGRSQMGGTRHSVLVTGVTMDSLLEISDPPSVVKIDVEGAECMALRGAAQVLREARPTFYIEVGESQNGEVTSIFRDANYVLFDGDIPAQDRTPLDHCTANTLAIPNERV